MLVFGGTAEASLLDPPQVPPIELVQQFDLEASTWHPKAALLGEGSEPAPWNLVYHSVFKVDTQNVGVLWYDRVEERVQDPASGANVDANEGGAQATVK